MTETDLAARVGPELASALSAKGYGVLTPVQEVVLDPALEGRDLRITSQTGSGKTLAIGFAVRHLVEGSPHRATGAVRPRVLVLAPTRELAKQVSDELSWLFAPMGVRVAAVTGGSGYLDQKRALSSDPAVLVATPGRLRDVLERGRVDASALRAVVLDEADSMLDLGFREDLDAILALLPAERRSHLASATFSRDVVALADRFQRDPVHVEGTRLGEANSDIEHVVHLIEPGQRVDALVNLLLSDEDAKSLVFVRTRADVARVAGELAEAGFVVRALSGEMEQAERDRALAAFRAGGVQALVATDVAARGIDVRDIARVIQVEPPTDVETYTHRSGRTGRAGKRGTSVLFVAPSHYVRIARGLARAKIPHRVEAIPSAAVIRQRREDRLVAWLARDEADEGALDPHAVSIAERLVAGERAAIAVARLVERAGLRGPTEPRHVRPIAAPGTGGPPHDRGARSAGIPPVTRGAGTPPSARGARGAGISPAARGAPGTMPASVAEAARPRPVREKHADAPGPAGRAEWVTFRVTWGGRHGADARRLLAVVCRRGDIRGSDVGAIRVEAAYSLVDIAAGVADRAEKNAAKPDERNPLVHIMRADRPAAPHRPSGAAHGRSEAPAPPYGAGLRRSKSGKPKRRS